jgi:nitrogen fixation protein FixH
MTRSFAVKGWHVLLGLAVFFGLVFAINGAFIYLALKTHPGDDVKDAYAGGLAFNRELAEKRAQEKLGWQASLSVSPAPGNRQSVELAFVDAEARPLYGLSVAATLRNPVVAGRDRRITFASTGAGTFRAIVDEPAGARWDLLVEARSERGEIFRLRHRL